MQIIVSIILFFAVFLCHYFGSVCLAQEEIDSLFNDLPIITTEEAPESDEDFYLWDDEEEDEVSTNNERVPKEETKKTDIFTEERSSIGEEKRVDSAQTKENFQDVLNEITTVDEVKPQENITPEKGISDSLPPSVDESLETVEYPKQPLFSTDKDNAITISNENGIPAVSSQDTVYETSLPASDETAETTETVAIKESKEEISKTGSDDYSRLTWGSIVSNIGVGLNIGARFHAPEKLNNYVTDVWLYSVFKSIKNKVDKQNLSPGVLIKIKGTMNLWNYLQVEPFSQFLWAGRIIKIRGYESKDIYINNNVISGGINCLFSYSLNSKLSFKIGAGFVGVYSFLNVTGDIEKIKLKGPGYWGNGMTSVNYALGERLAVGIDLVVPFGMSRYTRIEGEFSSYKSLNEYPRVCTYAGFEICPGIIYYF